MRSEFSITSGAFISDNFSGVIEGFYDIDSAALIRVLSRLYDPKALFLMTLEKSVPLVITFFLNMIGLRNVIKRIFAYSYIISLHVVVKGFFVGQIPVKL